MKESRNFTSHIDGFLVALNIRNYTQSRLPPQSTEPQPTNCSPFCLPPSTENLRQSLSDLQTSSHDAKETTRHGSSDQPEPGGISWQFIEEVRNATKDLWRRFQASVEVLNVQRLREMSSSYHNAEGLCNQGLLAFRETMLGHVPTELEKVFAMASTSYIVSKVLCSREILLESDILDGVSIWIKRIASQEDRNIFNGIAQRLWWKHRTHLDVSPVQANEPILDFMNMNMSNPFQDPFSFNYPLTGPAPGQCSPIATSSVVSYNADSSYNGLAGPHAYAPTVGLLGSGDSSSLNYGHESFNFGSAPAESPYQPCRTPRAFGAERSGYPAALPPWPPMVYDFVDTSSQPVATPEKARDEFADTLGNCRASKELQDSKSFCVLRAMFSYLDNSLCRLSGDRATQEDNSARLSSNLDEDFKRKALEELRKPRPHSSPPCDDPSHAIKLVAAQFIDWALLQTLDETRSFMKSIGKELISDELVYAGFRNWIALMSASSDGHNSPKTPRRTINAKRAGASTSITSKTIADGQEVFTCPECGRWFPQRKNLLRHVNTMPHPRKYKKRGRSDVDESNSKRRRDS